MVNHACTEYPASEASTGQRQPGDFIFLDANGDGDQTGDKGIAGVTVELIQDGKVIVTTAMAIKQVTVVYLESLWS